MGMGEHAFGHAVELSPGSEAKSLPPNQQGHPKLRVVGPPAPPALGLKPRAATRNLTHDLRQRLVISSRENGGKRGARERQSEREKQRQVGEEGQGEGERNGEGEGGQQ